MQCDDRLSNGSLREVLAAGVPAELALEAVDSCLDARTIISAYGLAQGGE